MQECHGLSPSLIELKPFVPSYIIGTVFVESPNKSSVLIDLAEGVSALTVHQPLTILNDRQRDLCAQQQSVSYYGVNSVIWLEDESTRVRLDTSQYTGSPWITGCVVAVLGFLGTKDSFVVMDVCVCNIPPPHLYTKGTPL